MIYKPYDTNNVQVVNTEVLDKSLLVPTIQIWGVSLPWSVDERRSLFYTA